MCSMQIEKILKQIKMGRKTYNKNRDRKGVWKRKRKKERDKDMLKKRKRDNCEKRKRDNCEKKKEVKNKRGYIMKYFYV